MPLYDFSEEDIARLRGIVAAELRRAPRPRGGEPDAPPRAGDVFLALTPEGGIPAPSYGDTGTGTGDPGWWTGTGTADWPGVADCEVWRAVRAAGRLKLVKTPGGPLEVLNAGPGAVPGNAWVLVHRDTFGAWWCQPPGSGLPTPEGCVRWFSGYGHLGTALVSLGQYVDPGQLIGTIGPHSNGAHLHHEVGSGKVNGVISMMDPPTANFVGQSLYVADVYGMPVLGDFDPDNDPPGGQDLTDEEADAIRARIRMPLPANRGFVETRGANTHSGPAYFALDLSTPPPSAGSSDEVGTPVRNCVVAPDVVSRVVYRHDHGGDLQTLVILEHRLGSCPQPWADVEVPAEESGGNWRGWMVNCNVCRSIVDSSVGHGCGCACPLTYVAWTATPAVGGDAVQVAAPTADAGRLALVAINHDGGAVTPPAGWTALASGTIGARRYWAGWKLTGASDGTYSFGSVGVSDADVLLASWSDAEVEDSDSDAGATAAVTPPQVTSEGAGRTRLAVVLAESAASAPPPPAGFEAPSALANTARSVLYADDTTGEGGQPELAVTLPAAAQWAALSVLIRPARGATGRMADGSLVSCGKVLSLGEGVTVREADGSPSGRASVIEFSGATVAVSSGVATVTVTGGSGIVVRQINAGAASESAVADLAFDGTLGFDLDFGAADGYVAVRGRPASATEAGIVTAGAQTVLGPKTIDAASTGHQLLLDLASSGYRTAVLSSGGSTAFVLLVDFFDPSDVSHAGAQVNPLRLRWTSTGGSGGGAMTELGIAHANVSFASAWHIGMAADFSGHYFWVMDGSTRRVGAAGTDALGNKFHGGICYEVGYGSVSGYTDEQAQDAVGGMLTDSDTIDLTYDDAAGTVTAAVKDGSLGTAKLGDDVTAAGKALLDDADAAAQRATLGATTVGANLFTVGDPGAIRFPRVNADNTVSLLSDSDMRAAIGAGTGDGTVSSVGVVAPAAGITVSGSPVTSSGNLTLALADDLAALEAMSGTGLVVRTAANTYAQRTITAGANISITNGNGVSGNPTVAVTGLAAVATSGSAADLSAGTLAAARMPALTGDVTSSAGSTATTIASAAVSYAKIQNVTANRMLGRYSLAGPPQEVSLGSSLALTAGPVLAVATNGITDALLRQSAGLSVVGRSASGIGNVADITAGTDHHVLRRSGTTLGFGLLTNSNIDAAAAIAISKLATQAANSILANATSGTASPTAVAIDADRVVGRTSVGGAVVGPLNITQVLDMVGSAANGDILVRSGGSWTRLAVGTNGRILRVASALPSWVQHSGRVLDRSFVATTEGTTSSSAVALATVDDVSFTLDEAGDVLVIWTANVYNTTANASSRDVVRVDGADDLTTTTDITSSTGSAAQTMTIISVRAGLSAGAHTIEIRHAAVGGGTANWRARSLVAILI